MARVLIIDDDESMRELLGRTFSAQGHISFLAADGKEASEKAVEIAPDVVVTDIWMPRREGLETIRLLKKLVPKARIVVISGRPVIADVSLFKIANALGADAALTKPFSQQEIVTLINDLLDGKDNTATNGNTRY